MARPAPTLQRELPRHAGWIVRRVLARGLSRDPAARFPGMAAVVAELESARDRSPRRWGVIAMLGLVALAGVAVVWFALGRSTRPATCSAAGELAGVWDAAARAALVAGFTASGHPDGKAQAERTASRLDEYAARWTAMRVDACRATVERRTQSAVALDLRMRCLDDRRAELGAVVAAASHPDRALVGRALETVGALSRLDDCADVSRLSASTPPPADDATRARVAAVRERLAHATGLGRAGRYADGLAAAATATSEAEQIGHAPLLAAALFRRGQLEGAVGKNVEAVATLERAVTEAAAAHDDVLVARAWTAQVEIVGHRLAHRDQGLVLARAADAAVIRAGRDPLLTADVAQMRGLILRGQARYADARVEMDRALALRRSALPEGDPAVAQAVHDIAEIERMLGEMAAARAHHEQALAARTAALGGDHPLVAVSHVNLGHVFYASGETAPAREHYLAALAIDERSLSPDHIEVGNVLVSLGAVALAEGDARAAESFERAGVIYRRALGENHPLVAMVENNLGEVARRSGKLGLAERHFAQALEIRKRGEGADERGIATVLNNLGDVLRMKGDVAAARASYQESLAIFEKLFGKDGALVAYPLMGLGALALEHEHDAAKAKRFFARALAIRENSEAAPSEIEEARAALAEAEKAR
jgi:tetratricopeptide (TPR) repeat protein